MKPRIRKIDLKLIQWKCSSHHPTSAQFFISGFGKTPFDAYEAWLERAIRAGAVIHGRT